MQHVVRNVTTTSIGVIATSLLAVALLAVQQYRWTSELAAARRDEVRRSWGVAVDRAARAVDEDLSSVYAAIVGASSIESADTPTQWLIGARSTIPAGVLRVYERQPGSAQWRPIDGRDPNALDALPPAVAFADIDASEPSTENGAAWLPPARSQSLPALLVGTGPHGEHAMLVAFTDDACARLLASLARQFFAADPAVALVIAARDDAAHPVCADAHFEPMRSVDAGAAIFQLHPRRPASPSAAMGVVMSQRSVRASWQLLAQHAPTAIDDRAGRVQRRTLTAAFGLELVLLAALAVVVSSARRAQRTADVHLKFAAAVAHELRTPLAAIKVLAQNQARGLVRRDDHVTRYGETIAAEVDRLHAFVERALHFSAARSPALVASAPVDLDRVVAAAVSTLRDRAAAAGVRLTTAVDVGARATTGDEPALVLAVRNLVQNALDHAAGVSAIDVSVARAGASIVVTVADDGSGVDRADRATLFEPFVRGRSPAARAHGLGLGLAIVRDIAAAHGGHAWHAARPRGSRFSFSIAARDAAGGRA